MRTDGAIVLRADGEVVADKEVEKRWREFYEGVLNVMVIVC